MKKMTIKDVDKGANALFTRLADKENEIFRDLQEFGLSDNEIEAASWIWQDVLALLRTKINDQVAQADVRNRANFTPDLKGRKTL